MSTFGPRSTFSRVIANNSGFAKTMLIMCEKLGWNKINLVVSDDVFAVDLSQKLLEYKDFYNIQVVQLF